MDKQTVSIDSKNWKARAALLVILIAAGFFGWNSIRIQLGAMIGELTMPNDPFAVQKAEIAGELAPRDPSSRWLAASLEKDRFTVESTRNSVKLFEDVIRLAPYDFRFWIELARTYEQIGEVEKSEVAFKRAIELAPNYTFPNWQAGNFYLRQGKADEAFAHLKKTTENNLPYREQVFSLAWEYFDKDPKMVEQFAGDSADTRAYLALFFATKKAPMDALRVWNTLSDEDKAANSVVSKTVTQSLYERRYFRAAVEFSRQVGLDPDAQAEAVTNGGFEKPIAPRGESYFGWNMLDVEKMKAEFDPTQKREGARSLKVTFSGYSKPDLFNIWQSVALETGKKYRLSFWVRTNELRSGGNPTIEVLNGTDDKLVAVSKAFPDGTSDWQEMAVEFTAPENAEGVIIKTGRVSCEGNCPIIGTFWYDDFKLTKL